MLDQTEIRTVLVADLAARLKVPATAIDPDESLLALGADSILLTEMVGFVSRRFGVTIAIPKLFDDLDTLSKVATHLAAHAPATAPDPQPKIAHNFSNGNNDAIICDILQAQSALIDHVVTRQNQALATLPAYVGGSGSGWNSGEDTRRSHDTTVPKYP